MIARGCAWAPALARLPLSDSGHAPVRYVRLAHGSFPARSVALLAAGWHARPREGDRLRGRGGTSAFVAEQAHAGGPPDRESERPARTALVAAPGEGRSGEHTSE